VTTVEKKKPSVNVLLLEGNRPPARTWPGETVTHAWCPSPLRRSYTRRSEGEETDEGGQDSALTDMVSGTDRKSAGVQHAKLRTRPGTGSRRRGGHDRVRVTVRAAESDATAAAAGWSGNHAHCTSSAPAPRPPPPAFHRGLPHRVARHRSPVRPCGSGIAHLMSDAFWCQIYGRPVVRLCTVDLRP
jgi:hypothetical protein